MAASAASLLVETDVIILLYCSVLVSLQLEYYVLFASLEVKKVVGRLDKL